MNDSNYYNKNAKAFYERTIHANMQVRYDKFLSYLPKQAQILDAGCEVGRDSKYFISQGYSATAFDSSREMVKLAKAETGLNILQMTFQEMDFKDRFDGFWASASLLHIPYNEMKNVLQKARKALKLGGIFYASFKYGNSERQIDDRCFFDLNEISALPYMDGLFEPIELWTTPDSGQSASPDKLWLNILAKAK